MPQELQGRSELVGQGFPGEWKRSRMAGIGILRQTTSGDGTPPQGNKSACVNTESSVP